MKKLLESININLERLGGVEKISAHRADEKNNFEIGFFSEKHLDNFFFKELLFMVNLLGYKTFVKDVVIRGIKEVPGSGTNGELPVGFFLGFQSGAFSLINTLENICDQIARNHIPIAIGISGDYWVFNINDGAVFYWHHESPEDEDLFFVASDLISFFQKMEIDDRDEEGPNLVSYWLADDF